MAGHYHGGQFRIPFVGALFVLEAWYEKSGLFPPQDRVKGL
jgi:predicted MPP superfamily phosphohydrolase